jgi:hypothetical protein
MTNLVWSHHFANFTVAIMTLFAITNYHWAIFWMVCFVPFVGLSFPYWLWRRVIPYTWFRLRAHGGCDRSAEDAYSSMAPDPTFALLRVHVAQHSILYMFFSDYDYDWYLVNFAYYYSIHSITACRLGVMFSIVDSGAGDPGSNQEFFFFFHKMRSK